MMVSIEGPVDPKFLTTVLSTSPSITDLHIDELGFTYPENYGGIPILSLPASLHEIQCHEALSKEEFDRWVEDLNGNLGQVGTERVNLVIKAKRLDSRTAYHRVRIVSDNEDENDGQD